MKIATWNVNSLRVRLPHLLDWLADAQPDIVALQETKLTNDAFPCAELEAAGYQILFAGQKTYNGVALLSRGTGKEVATDLPGFDDPQRRVLAATYDNDLRIINLYVPNGSSVDSDKYHYKLSWLQALQIWLIAQLQQYPQLVVLGDFNIAPTDRDVHDVEKWADGILVSPPEREALQGLLALGLHDAFRLFEQPSGSFSWWDYRAAAFRRNHGLRIDLILISDVLKPRCTACSIDTAPRKRERPSDHTPVIVTLED